MTTQALTVGQYMTANPYTVEATDTVARAHAFLYEHRIRHLPVVRGERLVGLLTDRDLSLVSMLQDVDPNRVTVEEIMVVGLYKVTPETPLVEVAHEMATKKIGSAIVTQQGSVVGILTTVDVCSALVSVLNASTTAH